MTIPTIKVSGDGDRQRVINVITLGFSADPVARWAWPDARTYLEAMPRFVAAFGGRAFEHKTAWHADDVGAAALWLPPGIEPDVEALGVLIETTLSPELQEEAVSFFGRMAEFHPHDRPYWYLPMIAADPCHQGRGLGSALLKHALRRCDEEGLPAYLESSNPRNVPLYERHGFAVMGEIQAGSSPVTHPMLREPRG